MRNLTGYDGNSSLGHGQTFASRRQSQTLFKFNVKVDWQVPIGDLKEVGISIMEDQSQHFDIGIVMKSSLEPKKILTSGTFYAIAPNEFNIIPDILNVVPDRPTKPYIRFGGIEITGFRRPE